ncbi:MAG: glycosyltransferase family 2 protein [Synechococcaceae cyanobacterium]|nr:glycosyltransferase family 2 protein [Synechococcaceae cyanobacterium]
MNLLQSTPDISVVMGVRNAADTIESTIESLTSQQGPEFEIIVVDDGSTDDTAAILKTLAARDPRLRLFHSPPRGLTASLIDACSDARGQFLVRQDAGDWSLPGRFAKQIERLESSPEAVLCSCYVRFTVDDDVMIQIKQIPQELLQDGLTGPSQHGAVMMRRSAYIQAGGYRRMFYYAQDIDLWSRMAELGTHLVVPEVLYRSEASAGSISGSHRAEQARFHRIIVACTKARRSGASEEPFLRQAEQLSERCRKLRKSRRRMAAGHYFIGSCLMNSHPELARRYLNLALRDNPFHIRARLKLFRLH